VKLRLLACVVLAVAAIRPVPASAPATRSPAGRINWRPISLVWQEAIGVSIRGGKVDYTKLKDAEREKRLKTYVELLAQPRRLETRDKEMAFWLDAYNACVIAGIVERYPKIKSVMEVKDFFTAKRWEVNGAKRSLSEIENDIIRPKFKDPRVHFILVCGARSCPPLQPYAMNGFALQRDLDWATRQVVNDPRYVQIDAKAKRLRLTRIMSWHKQDFVDKYGSLEAFLLRYLGEPERSQLKQGEYSIEFMPYDWSLNDARAATPTKPARQGAHRQAGSPSTGAGTRARVRTSGRSTAPRPSG